MTDVGVGTNTLDARFWDIINICTKYGFDMFINKTNTGVMMDTDDTQRTMDNRGLTLASHC